MHGNTIEEVSKTLMPSFKDVYDAAALISRYCDDHDECRTCSLRPLCNTLNGGSIAFTYAFNQVASNLKERSDNIPKANKSEREEEPFFIFRR